MSIPTTNSAIATCQRILGALQRDAEIARSPLVQTVDPWAKQNMARSQMITQLWRKIGRQVLAIHPGIVDEVALATSDTIPLERLRALPYINPMVVYADPPVFSSWRKDDKPEKTRLLGFLTCGIKNFLNGEPLDNSGPVILSGNEQRIYATTNPEANRFGILTIMEILDENDRVIDLEFNTLTLFFTEEMTLAQVVDHLCDRFHWFLPQDQSHSKVARKWMRQVMSVIIGSLFYLCSTTLEAELVPRQQVAKRIPKRIARQSLSVIKVGWTTGVAVTRYRADRARVHPSEQGDLSHQQDPQHRRAHFKMQWYGSRNEPRCNNIRNVCSCGGQHRELIFVSAYWTHIEKLGEYGMNTARNVPLLGKGEAQASVRAALVTQQ